jgi:hypothetical protein
MSIPDQQKSCSESAKAAPEHQDPRHSISTPPSSARIRERSRPAPKPTKAVGRDRAAWRNGRRVSVHVGAHRAVRGPHALPTRRRFVRGLARYCSLVQASVQTARFGALAMDDERRPRCPRRETLASLAAKEACRRRRPRAEVGRDVRPLASGDLGARRPIRASTQRRRRTSA